MLLKRLNDDTLSQILGWLGGLDLFNCSLVCKRLYNLTNSYRLWRQAAEACRDESLPLPLKFEDNLENASLPYLRKGTVCACRLHHNLTYGTPQLYKHTIIKRSWDPRPWKKAAREIDRRAFAGFIHIFDGRWIISRRQEYISFRHITSTSWKDKFDKAIIEFTEWPFLISQVNRDVALIAVFHYPTRAWNILEVTLGETKDDEPQIRKMDITDVKSALALVGHGLIVCEIFGSETIIDVYSNQRLTLGQFKTETTRYCIADDILFSAVSTRLGQICVTAYRLGGKQGLVEPHTRALHYVLLKDELPPADSKTFHEVTYICRTTSRQPALTIWHSMRKDDKSGLRVQFVIELPYFVSDGLEGGGECVRFGRRWEMRSTRLPPGNHFVGINGLSSVITQYNQEKASIWAYPRSALPVGYNVQHFGKALPLPNKSCWGMELNAVRVAWDDARGIAVLVFTDGGMWILHYA